MSCLLSVSLRCPSHDVPFDGTKIQLDESPCGRSFISFILAGRTSTRDLLLSVNHSRAADKSVNTFVPSRRVGCCRSLESRVNSEESISAGAALSTAALVHISQEDCQHRYSTFATSASNIFLCSIIPSFLPLLYFPDMSVTDIGLAICVAHFYPFPHHPRSSW